MKILTEKEKRDRYIRQLKSSFTKAKNVKMITKSKTVNSIVLNAKLNQWVSPFKEPYKNSRIAKNKSAFLCNTGGSTKSQTRQNNTPQPYNYDSYLPQSQADILNASNSLVY